MDDGTYKGRIAVAEREGKESGFGDSGYPVIELPSFWGLRAVDDARDICWTIWALSLQCSL